MKLSPEYILDKHADEACWVIAEDLQENVILPSMEEYGNQKFNEAIRAIQKEYETNKDFNITSIIKYLK